MKNKTERDSARALDGIEELRACVRWANGQRESDHDHLTPAQILNRFRKAKAEW